MKRILVTGAGGFVGTHLVRELQKDKNAEIFASVYKATSDIGNLLTSDHILTGDLTDMSYVQNLIQSVKPDVAYHLAALSIVGSSFENALKIMHGNTSISYNLLESIRINSPKSRLIAICSANEYGAVENSSSPIDESTLLRPLNPYAISKVTQEMLALQYHLVYGLDIVILRPFNHTGPGQTTDFVIPKLASQFVQIENKLIPPVLEVGNLDTIRDFTDVRDMVRAYTLATTSCLPGEIYNIGSGTGHTIRQVISIFEELTHTSVELITNDSLVRKADVPSLIADCSKFNEATAYMPTISLNRTISDILESYRQQKG